MAMSRNIKWARFQFAWNTHKSKLAEHELLRWQNGHLIKGRIREHRTDWVDCRTRCNRNYDTCRARRRNVAAPGRCAGELKSGSKSGRAAPASVS